MNRPVLHRPTSRRAFLGTVTATAAVPFIIPSAAFGERFAPSGRLTMGLIGCGGMGRANLRGFMTRDEIQVLAVCDPDRARRDATRNEVLTHQERTERTTACDSYNDFRDLLARDDIDAVIVGSPDHWHAVHVCSAARAGKDIYGEKPLSLTIGQGRVMSDTVVRFGRVFQTGSQQRSDQRFHHACELVRNGRLGRIRRVTCGLPTGSRTSNHPEIPVPDGFDYDLWLGPAPAAPYCDQRTHYIFRHILDYSGGQLTDWGAHHIDIAQWALGTMETGPVSVDATGTFPEDGLWNAAIDYDIRCTYADGVEMLITNDAPNGVLFEGENGELFVSRGQLRATPSSILSERIGASEQRLVASRDHRGNFLECVRSRRTPIAPIEHAHRSISIAHLGNISMQVGRPLQWDPAAERIVGDEGADRLLDRAMRAPWRL
ncbi:MAG: Gfo/Idh/MocA family protein [Planctomycetota bacterium]|jgi:predicted dehydrogenase